MSYICAIYSNHVLKGQNYNQDTKIIQINFSYGLEDSEEKRVYYVQDQSNKKYVENFTIYEINMEKYINYWYTIKLLSKEDRMVKKYMSEMEKINSNPEFFEYMSAEEDNRKIENSIRREMIERGLKEGLEQGLEQAKIDIAHNMLKDGLDIVTIAKYTGLAKETIQEMSK